MPKPTHPTYLSRSAERALAAHTLAAATGASSTVAEVVIDGLDLTAAAVLQAGGLTDRDQSRAVLSILWSLDRDVTA